MNLFHELSEVCIHLFMFIMNRKEPEGFYYHEQDQNEKILFLNIVLLHLYLRIAYCPCHQEGLLLPTGDFTDDNDFSYIIPRECEQSGLFFLCVVNM